MTLYKRKWDCTVCGKELFYDTDRRQLSCGCGIRHLTYRDIAQLRIEQNFTPVTFKPTPKPQKPLTLLEAVKKVNEYISPHFEDDEQLEYAWNLILGRFGIQIKR